MASTKPWFCTDENQFVLLTNLSQAIICGFLFAVLLWLSIDFFKSLWASINNREKQPPRSESKNGINKKSFRKSGDTDDASIKPKPTRIARSASTTANESVVKGQNPFDNNNTSIVTIQESPQPPTGQSSPAQSPATTPRSHNKSFNSFASRNNTFVSQTNNNTHYNNKNRKKGLSEKERIKRKQKMKYGCACIIFVFACLFLEFVTSIGKLLCYFDDSSVISLYISHFGHTLLYAMIGLSLCLIFVLRLKQTFENSIYQVEKKQLKIMIIGSILVPFIVLCGSALRFVTNTPTIESGLFVLAAIIYIFMTILLVYMYVWRLNKVRSNLLAIVPSSVNTYEKTRNDDNSRQPKSLESAYSEDNEMENSVRSKSEELFETTIKLVILVCLSLFTTFITICFYFYGFSQPWKTHRYLTIYVNFFISIDTFVNAICFMLQFNFNDKYYKFCCKLCQRKCQNLFDPTRARQTQNMVYQD